MKESVANSVSRFRQERGDTQEKLADEIGVTRQTIIAIERGNYAPSVLLALKLAVYFSKSVETLFSIHVEK